MENLHLTLCPCFVSTISTTSVLTRWKCWHISVSSAPTAAGTLSLYRIIPLPSTRRPVSADLSLLPHLMQRLCKKNAEKFPLKNLFGPGSMEKNFFSFCCRKWWWNHAYMISGRQESVCKRNTAVSIHCIYYAMPKRKATKLLSTDFPLFLTPVRSESDQIS